MWGVAAHHHTPLAVEVEVEVQGRAWQGAPSWLPGSSDAGSGGAARPGGDGGWWEGGGSAMEGRCGAHGGGKLVDGV